MSLGAIRAKWSIYQDTGELMPVEGLQIGRFGVSPLGGGLWRIDHLPSRFGVVELDVDFATALAIADDLNIYAVRDPASSDPENLTRDLGENIKEWLMEMLEQDAYTMSFRQWAQEHGVRARPLRPPRKGPYR